MEQPITAFQTPDCDWLIHRFILVSFHRKVLIKRVRAETECAIGEEQCGFRQGRRCMDQVFAVRKVCEKYLANGKDVFWPFMDLEKAYDTIDRHGMWQC